ncbi:MAG: DUF1549 domain-containing protein [Planctomycetales bacterium]|nr:DUF1549 domain-containing protein [Planctomycetales bacterium]
MPQVNCERIATPCSTRRSLIANVACALLALLPSYDALAEFVDFETEVMPILTRAGCNTAACHGAATGQGGFRLSLFGGDPDADYRAIVRDLEGRRVNSVRPADSLLVAKPTETVTHGGGLVFEPDSEHANINVIEQWIAAGARRDTLRVLTGLVVQPATVTIRELPDRFSLRVLADFADAEQRDVTSLAVVRVLDESAVDWDAESQVRVKRPGRHYVVVRFGQLTRVVSIVAPYGSAEDGSLDEEYPESVSVNGIDRVLDRDLALLGLTPVPSASDECFLRRCYLDLTGRLPDETQTLAFLGDTRTEKRAVLVDALLGSDAFRQFWTHRLARHLRIDQLRHDQVAAATLRTWLHDQLAADADWRSVVRALALGEGDSHQSGPAAWQRLHSTARDQAEYVSEVFLGVQLRCANCHNHPLDHWTQDDYHGLAQVFANIRREQIVQQGGDGYVVHPRTGRPAVPRVPGGPALDADLALTRWTEWITEDADHGLARATVVWIWTELMGSTLVDPPDDLRVTNPPVHPELLDQLTHEFVDGGYRIRPLIRLVCQSEAYGRASRREIENGTRFQQAMSRKSMSAPVLADAVDDVLGVRRRRDEADERESRAIGLLFPAEDATLQLLGACADNQACRRASGNSRGLASQLFALNGPWLNGRLSSHSSWVQELFDCSSVDDAIGSLYLRAYCRRPTAEETEFWRQEIEPAESEAARREVWEDLVWSVLNSQEFVNVR